VLDLYIKNFAKKQVAIKWSITEYIFKIMGTYFNRIRNFATRFLEFYSSHGLGSVRTLTAITHQCLAYLPKVAL